VAKIRSGGSIKVGYLRILLALSVAVGHLQSHLYAAPDSTIIFVGPVVAVKLFFVISGFYMAMIFHKHYSTTSMFLVSRAVRLFPAYWLTIAFCLAAVVWFERPNVGPFINLDFWYFVRSPAALSLFTLSNLTFFGIDFGFIACVNTAAAHFVLTWNVQCPAGYVLLVQDAVIPPAWTLSLEWYFYLLVPFFCAMGAHRVALIAGGSFLLTVFIAVFANFNPWYRSLFPAELYLFLLGFLAYRLKDFIPPQIGRTCAVLVMGIILAYQPIAMFDWQNPAGANFALYFALALALPVLFDMGNYIPGERVAGDLSYPIYICHGAVESVILALLLHDRMSLVTWIATNVAIVVATSALLLLATAPIERFRLRFKSPWRDISPSARLA
jgi:peptidoglycan/LPS O-acetylase OafA/YrhL